MLNKQTKYMLLAFPITYYALLVGDVVFFINSAIADGLVGRVAQLFSWQMFSVITNIIRSNLWLNFLLSCFLEIVAIVYMNTTGVGREKEWVFYFGMVLPGSLITGLYANIIAHRLAATVLERMLIRGLFVFGTYKFLTDVRASLKFLFSAFLMSATLAQSDIYIFMDDVFHAINLLVDSTCDWLAGVFGDRNARVNRFLKLAHNLAVDAHSDRMAPFMTAVEKPSFDYMDVSVNNNIAGKTICIAYRTRPLTDAEIALMQNVEVGIPLGVAMQLDVARQ